MRIPTKLSLIVAAVFFIVGTVGALALERLRGVAETAIETHAKQMAGAMATMAAYEMQQAQSRQAHIPFQHIIDFITAREKRDLEVIDTNLVFVADVDLTDIGKPVEGERRAIVARTLRDGLPRIMLEAASADLPEMRQVVVPIADRENRIIAALIYEYTPLYAELAALVWHALAVIAAVATAGLALALVCAMYLSRTISRPLLALRDAALQLSRGKRDVQVDCDARDEIGELATTFNAMSQALGTSRVSLEARAHELSLANRDLQKEVLVRKLTEQALHLRERAIESSFNAIVIADLTQPHYPIAYVNPAFTRITGYGNAEALGRSLDFLVDADSGQPGLQEIRLALRERREVHAVLRCSDKHGKPFWNEMHVAPVRNDDGAPQHCVVIFNDITEAKNDAEQLARQAHFDGLTGLANRSLLLDRVAQAIANAGRHGDSVVLASIDLDDFKLVNDSLGHDAGDALLKTVAARLQSCVRGSDTVARLGGDEFVLLLLNQAVDGDAALAAQVTEQVQKLLACIAEPLALAGRDLRISCSIGIALYPQNGADADTLLKNADTAMYRAKELGRHGFQFFTAALQERVLQQIELDASLRQALEREEFELHYQPQVSLRSGKVVGIEALLRWRHPRQGLIGPSHFIAFAEESGLIIPIGAWVLMRACMQNKAWQDAGLAAIPVAVNVSAKQFAQQDLEAVVRHALDRSGLPAKYLELELTESLSMADPEKSVPLMERMKEIGVELSIDDFGTGYSNMSYLKRFPIDRLKLDISFVRDITTDPGSQAISDAIITMAHSLRLEVVAEGVETEGQLALLAARGCDLIQGYYFSKPLPAPELMQLLRDGRRLPGALTGRTPASPALLVLDDDPYLLEFMELVLATDGYVVHTTTEPQQAFELLACHEVAVILCDQCMPQMNGVDFLSRVRHMYPQTIRILLSAYEDYQVTRQAINMGAVYKFIEKPVQVDELKDVVEAAYGLYLATRQAENVATVAHE
ncbi:MAG: EAL domain-containing protein [Pseudomonadota bacterium]